MPYIPTQMLRRAIDRDVERLCHRRLSQSSPRLCYALCRMIVHWLPDNPRWSDLSDALKALDCAREEFYRCVIAPYEDAKRKANGDVWRKETP